MSWWYLEHKLPVPIPLTTPSEDEVSILIKFLDAVITAVNNVDITLGIKSEFGRPIKSV